MAGDKKQGDKQNGMKPSKVNYKLDGRARLNKERRMEKDRKRQEKKAMKKRMGG